MTDRFEPTLRATQGRDELALVHLLQLRPAPWAVVETVDSVDPRYPRADKAVIIISTQYGCPVGCLMCEATSGAHRGNLTADELLAQVQFVLRRRPEDPRSRKLKVHFARMGEPALNAAAVIEAVDRLPGLCRCDGLMPCVSTMAPTRGAAELLAGLRTVKQRRYRPGQFQLQLSVNSTDEELRRRLMPTPHLGLEELAELAAPLCGPGDRKVALNFALARGIPVDPHRLRAVFDPERFMVKLTPVNPTERAERHALRTVIDAAEPGAADALARQLRDAGYDALVSIGEAEEIAIGSNCGQLVRAHRAQRPDPAFRPAAARVVN